MEQQHDVDSALYGIAIDPCDLRRTVPIGAFTFWPYHAGMSGDGAIAILDEYHPSRTETNIAGYQADLQPTQGPTPGKCIKKQTLSFQCSKVMEWLRTPPAIWAELTHEFDFTVDVCASHENHLLPRYYTEEEDGLAQDWTGEVVYCHPLFDGKIGRWVEKAFFSKCVTVLLLPAATHTRYFHRFIHKNPKCEIRFLEKPTGGFRFGKDDGSSDDPKRIGYIKGLMIVVFRNHAGMSGSRAIAIRDEHYPSRTVESFARETSAGAVRNVADWDDQAVLAGMKAECGEIRALDANYPGRYHRLGTFILESTKRFGGDAVRQTLRDEGINSTKAYWANEIALLYTYEQATEFASIRAIVRTLPPKQPRKAKWTAGDPQVTADIEQTILDSPAQTANRIKCCASIKDGDVLAVLQKMDANTFDGCLHDGPYALTTIGKRFGGRTSKPPKTDKGSNGVYGRIAKGFMNQTWDGDLPSVETYQELLRVCKPGSWMLAFGHPRTWHRLACNIEDAGWELRDCLMWFYGQGFPKSRDLRTIGEAWAGYGFALKPGYEPIVMAMKPLEGSFADNARKWGLAGLNIEGCRIGQDEITINRWTDGCKPFGNGAGHAYDAHHSEGRYPANVMLDEEAAHLLDLQGPISRGGQYRRSGERDCRHKGNWKPKTSSVFGSFAVL